MASQTSVLCGIQAVKQADRWLPAEGHAETKHQAQLEAHTSLAGALHASGDQAGANLQCQTALTLATHDTSDLPHSSIAAALKQAAALRFAQVTFPLCNHASSSTPAIKRTCQLPMYYSFLVSCLRLARVATLVAPCTADSTSRLLQRNAALWDGSTRLHVHNLSYLFVAQGAYVIRLGASMTHCLQLMLVDAASTHSFLSLMQ